MVEPEGLRVAVEAKAMAEAGPAETQVGRLAAAEATTRRRANDEVTP